MISGAKISLPKPEYHQAHVEVVPPTQLIASLGVGGQLSGYLRVGRGNEIYDKKCSRKHDDSTAAEKGVTCPAAGLGPRPRKPPNIPAKTPQTADV